jgi:hypothetical protein
MRHSRLLLLVLTCLLAVVAARADTPPAAGLAEIGQELAAVDLFADPVEVDFFQCPALEPLADICECTKAAQCHYLSCPRGTRPVCLCSCECR